MRKNLSQFILIFSILTFAAKSDGAELHPRFLHDVIQDSHAIVVASRLRETERVGSFKVVEFSAAQVLKGEIKRGGGYSCACQEILGEGCSLNPKEEQFLFLSKMPSRFPLFPPLKEKRTPPYLCRIAESGDLKVTRDLGVVQKLVSNQTELEELVRESLKGEGSLAVQATLLMKLLQQDPQGALVPKLFHKTLWNQKEDILMKREVLRRVVAFGDKIDASTLVDIVEDHFLHSGQEMMSEMQFIERVPVSLKKKRDFFLEEISKRYAASAMHHLGNLKDKEGVRLAYAKIRAGKISKISPNLIQETTRALYLVRECHLMGEAVEKIEPVYSYYLGDQDLPSGSMNAESASNYYRCLSHEDSEESAKELLLVLDSKGSQKGAKAKLAALANKSPRVKRAALGAIEAKLKKGTFPKKYQSSLKRAVTKMALEKDAKVSSRKARRFLKQHFPEPTPKKSTSKEKTSKKKKVRKLKKVERKLK